MKHVVWICIQHFCGNLWGIQGGMWTEVKLTEAILKLQVERNSPPFCPEFQSPQGTPNYPPTPSQGIPPESLPSIPLGQPATWSKQTTRKQTSRREGENVCPLMGVKTSSPAFSVWQKCCIRHFTFPAWSLAASLRWPVGNRAQCLCPRKQLYEGWHLQQGAPMTSSGIRKWR